MRLLFYMDIIKEGSTTFVTNYRLTRMPVIRDFSKGLKLLFMIDSFVVWNLYSTRLRKDVLNENLL
jgi:hypothetical protein